jgi:hypothetical protein
MADVVTFKDLTNVTLEMEGEDVLVAKFDLSQDNGETGGGNRRVATTHGLTPTIAGKHKVTIGFNISAKK